jgi:hypothetical protein
MKKQKRRKTEKTKTNVTGPAQQAPWGVRCLVRTRTDRKQPENLEKLAVAHVDRPRARIGPVDE